MTHVSEEQFALYVGGDLTREETAIVETHVQGCTDCGALLADFRDSQALLLGSVGEPAADELLSVRHGVIR